MEHENMCLGQAILKNKDKTQELRWEKLYRTVKIKTFEAEEES